MLLPGYFDNKLKQEDELEIEEHIATCPECIDYYTRVKVFSDSLSSLHDVKLPESVLSKLSKVMEAQGVGHFKTDITRGLVAHKRQIVHSLAIIFYTIAILAITAIIIRVSFMQDIRNNDGSNEKLTAQSTAVQPPVSLKNPAKLKQDEPGAGGQKRVVGEAFPKPEVSITHTQYSPGNIDNARFQPIVLDFSMTYETKQVPRLLDDYIKKSALAADSSKENGTVLAACIRQTLSNLNRPALPAYIEKISYNKRAAWLIVDVWSPDNRASTLSKSKIFFAMIIRGENEIFIFSFFIYSCCIYFSFCVYINNDCIREGKHHT
jgi:hypothetical protein